MMFYKTNFKAYAFPRHALCSVRAYAQKQCFAMGNSTVNKKPKTRRTTLIGKVLHFYSIDRYFTNPLLIKKQEMLEIQHNLKKVNVSQKVEKKRKDIGKGQGLDQGIETVKRLYPYKKREKKRCSLVLPQHIGRVFLVHNGKTWSSIHIFRKMLGHKFGEFASTRKKPVHKKKR